MRSVLLLAALFLAAPALAQPLTFTGGLAVALPDHWQGETEVDEARLPQVASYRFENGNPESPLYGAVLHVERVTGLNPLMRERWIQGRVPFGYHGAQPVAALPPSQVTVEGAVGFRTVRDDRGGVVYFTSRGQTYYAVQVEAPAAVFETHEAALLALAGAIRLPAE